MKATHILTLATFLLFSTVAIAQPQTNGNNKCQNYKKMNKACNMNKQNKSPRGLFYELNLTDAQKQKFQELKQKQQNQRAQNKGKMGPKMGDFVTEKGFNKKKFIEAHTAHSNTRANIMAQSFEEKYNILTPEQKKRYIELLKEKEDRMQRNR